MLLCNIRQNVKKKLHLKNISYLFFARLQLQIPQSQKLLRANRVIFYAVKHRFYAFLAY